MNAKSRPLIELAEGAEADDRASLFSAWKRLNDNPARRKVTNLHVRELLLYVLATNTHGRGTKMTYEEIAVRLECSRSTARSVVDRASNEYGLLAVMEDRYVDGGQTANRYSINWPMVRTVNLDNAVRPQRQREQAKPGVVTQHPPVVTQQGAVVTRQGAAVTRHPSKETPVLSPVSNQYSPLPPAAEKPPAGPEVKTWEVVVSALVGLGMGGADEAVAAAQGRSVTATEAWELVERWQRLQARQPGDVTIGWLYRWLVGKSQPPPEPWETTHGGHTAAPSPRRRRATTSDSTRVELIRCAVLKSGRRAGATDEQMSAALANRLQKAGYPRDAVAIDGSENIFTGGRIVCSASST